MASSEVMETVNWSTIKLSNKLEVFKLMFNAYKNILPDQVYVEIFLVNKTIATRWEGTRQRPSADTKADLWKTH